MMFGSGETFADICALVDRAFVHMDYADYNLPSHLQQDS